MEIAVASANEVEAHLSLAHRAGILSAEIHTKLEKRLILERRMLIALMRALKHQIALDENQRT